MHRVGKGRVGDEGMWCLEKELVYCIYIYIHIHIHIYIDKMDFERERVGDPGKGRECMCVRDREHAYNNQVGTFGTGIL